MELACCFRPEYARCCPASASQQHACAHYHEPWRQCQCNGRIQKRFSRQMRRSRFLYTVCRRILYCPRCRACFRKGAERRSGLFCLQLFRVSESALCPPGRAPASLGKRARVVYLSGDSGRKESAGKARIRSPSACTADPASGHAQAFPSFSSVTPSPGCCPVLHPASRT